MNSVWCCHVNRLRTATSLSKSRLIATGRGALRREPRRRRGASSSPKTRTRESHSHPVIATNKASSVHSTTHIKSFRRPHRAVCPRVSFGSYSSVPLRRMKSGGHVQRQQDRRHI